MEVISLRPQPMPAKPETRNCPTYGRGQLSVSLKVNVTKTANTATDSEYQQKIKNSKS